LNNSIFEKTLINNSDESNFNNLISNDIICENALINNSDESKSNNLILNEIICENVAINKDEESKPEKIISNEIICKIAIINNNSEESIEKIISNEIIYENTETNIIEREEVELNNFREEDENIKLTVKKENKNMFFEKNNKYIFYINLNRSIDRKKYMDKILKNIPFKIFRLPAYDEKDIIKYKNKIKSKFKFPIQISHSDICCALSHIKIWKLSVKFNLPYVIIFEDDISLTENFLSEINYCFDNLPRKWDIIYLGISKLCGKLNSKFVRLNSEPYYNYGLFGYIINTNFIKYILNEFKSNPIDSQLDVYINSYFNIIHAYVLYPNISET
jgi:GR25 family glycosyltransferase involved in LPS biosynthesis